MRGRAIGTLALVASIACAWEWDSDMRSDHLPSVTNRVEDEHSVVFGSESKADNGGTVTMPDPPAAGTYAMEREQTYLNCVDQDVEATGVEIDCQAVCEKVCMGRTNCPCNSKPGQTGCWVPKKAAKRWCSEIDNCRAISNFDKVREDEKGPFFDAMAQQWKCDCAKNQTMDFLHHWSHLGDLPLVKRRNFRTAICRDGPGRPPVCDKAVVQAVRSVSPAECNPWVELGLLNSPKADDMFRACACVDHVAAASTNQTEPLAVSGELAPSDLHCALECFQNTLDTWKTMCAQPKCSVLDNCTRCLTYWNPSTATRGGAWRLLKDINMYPTIHTCEFSADKGQCMLLDKTNGAKVMSSVSVCSPQLNGLPEVAPPPAGRVRNGTVHHTSATPTPTPTPTRALYDEEDRRMHPIRVHGVRGDPKFAGINTLEISGKPWRPDDLNETDVENTVVGNAISHRHYVDRSHAPLHVVMGCVSVPDDGVIDEWQVYGNGPGVLTVQVLRPVEAPADLKDNPAPISTYKLVGANELALVGVGAQTFPIAPSQRIRVQKGDVFGFYGGIKHSNHSYTGIVSWSEGGQQVHFRYGLPGSPTQGKPNHHDYGRVDPMYRSPPGTDVFVGEGIARTYSLAAKGRFPGASILLEAAHGLAASHSASPAPSPSASTSTPADKCSAGPDYWCQGPGYGEACGIQRRDWAAACVPSPSPSPQACDALMRCPAGQRPKRYDDMPDCFVAERDCEECTTGCDDVWRAFERGTFGPPRDFGSGPQYCPYCMGGDDWTGVCQKGKRQSPIKVNWEGVETDETARMHFKTHYAPTNSTLVHTGTALMMRGDFGTLDVEGGLWDATTVIVRTPAEHQVEGARRAPVELQVVHKQRYADGGSLGTMIVSVLFDDDGVEGADTMNPSNVEMAKVSPYELPSGADTPAVAVVEFDLNALVSEIKPIVWYEGSLTVPPCTEGVKWAVQMGRNDKLTLSQVARLDSLFRHNPAFAKGRGNNRHTQPTNGRSVVLRHNCGFPGAIACPQ